MVNIIGNPNMVPPLVEGPDKEECVTPRMAAKAILQCRPNSHPFPERSLTLDQPVKVGRSVARARPAKNNAIFDCKVLSRNHALLWYENGKFFLQDTKSSNGTFVNNQRLSKGSEESAPREVCSGDVVQFGVDVMENSRKGTDNTVTHGCIIATLKLFMPDGQEAKASSFTATGDGSVSISAQDLLHLKTCLQEAQHREDLIESKLTLLKQILKNTQDVASTSWSAMIDEDRLLQRLENLEGQLMTYVKNYPEEASREEIKRILEEKNRFETSAKESLERILTEKTMALGKCSDLERINVNTKEELAYMKQVAEAAQNELEELLVKQAAQTLEIEEMGDKLKAVEEKLDDSKANNDSDKKEIEEQDAEKEKLIIQIESLKAENDFTKEQLSSIKAKYENIKNGKLNMANILSGADAVNLDIDDVEVQKNLQMFRSAVHSLQERLWQTQEELHQTQSSVTQLKNEAEVADKIENKATILLGLLQDELNDKKSKEEANHILINHLHSQLGILEARLRNVDPETPKIYEDIYEDNSMTLGRYKKATKGGNNKDECKDEEENEKSSDNEETADTTIINEIVDKNSINGTDKGLFQFDSESLIYLKEDIIKIQEILQLAETSKSSAEEELKRIRDEYGHASTSSANAVQEAANLHHQLAASEAVLLEKTRYVSTLQEVSGQLESSLDLIYSHISVLTHRITKEKEEAFNAKNQAEDFKSKLQEAEILCKESVEEAEKLRVKINALEKNDFSPEILSNNLSTALIVQSSQLPDSTSIVSHDKDNAKGTNSCEIEDSPDNSAMVPRLYSEIDRLKKAYDDLKEKENKLRLQISSSNNSPTESPTKSSSSTTIESINDDQRQDDEALLKLKDELRCLYDEHKRLKETLIINEGVFADLNHQNKMAVALSVIPLMILVVGLLMAFYDMIAALTGTTEYSLPE